MQLHPYRTEIPEAPSRAHPCALCLIREKLTRVPLRTVVTGALAATFLFLNATAAASSFESLRLTRKMFVNASAITPTATPWRSVQAAPVVASPAGLKPALTLPGPDTPERQYLRVSTDEYLLTRAAVDDVLGEVASMMPARRPPRDDGLRHPPVLSQLLPTMLLARLGFRNGDAIRAVNGLDLSSPGMALEAYASFRTVSDLLVEVERDGHVRKVAYHVI